MKKRKRSCDAACSRIRASVVVEQTRRALRAGGRQAAGVCLDGGNGRWRKSGLSHVPRRLENHSQCKHLLCGASARPGCVCATVSHALAALRVCAQRRNLFPVSFPALPKNNIDSPAAQALRLISHPHCATLPNLDPRPLRRFPCVLPVPEGSRPTSRSLFPQQTMRT